MGGVSGRTKRRKRKQRTVKVEETLDEETLNLLSMNSYLCSLSILPIGRFCRQLPRRPMTSRKAK